MRCISQSWKNAKNLTGHICNIEFFVKYDLDVFINTIRSAVAYIGWWKKNLKGNIKKNSNAFVLMHE